MQIAIDPLGDDTPAEHRARLKNDQRIKLADAPTGALLAHPLAHRGIRCTKSLYFSRNGGGDGGIRTLDTRSRDGSLAGNWFQPLTHVSAATCQAVYGMRRARYKGANWPLQPVVSKKRIQTCDRVADSVRRIFDSVHRRAIEKSPA